MRFILPVRTIRVMRIHATLILVILVSPVLHDASAQTLELAPDDTWVEVQPVQPGSPEFELMMVRRSLADGDHGRTEFLAGQWLNRHPGHPDRALVHLARGDALRMQGKLYEALFDYEVIARTLPGSTAFVTAAERELEIATLFVTGTRRAFLGMRLLNASEDAEELLIRIQERLPGSRIAERAALILADYYFRSQRAERLALAIDMYSIFIENYPDSEFIDGAQSRVIQAHRRSFKGLSYDATGLYEAQSRLRHLKISAPATAYHVEADRLLGEIVELEAAKQLHIARWYHGTGDFIASEYTIRRLVESSPGSRAASDARAFLSTFLEKLPGSVRHFTDQYVQATIPSEILP